MHLFSHFPNPLRCLSSFPEQTTTTQNSPGDKQCYGWTCKTTNMLFTSSYSWEKEFLRNMVNNLAQQRHIPYLIVSSPKKKPFTYAWPDKKYFKFVKRQKKCNFIKFQSKYLESYNDHNTQFQKYFTLQSCFLLFFSHNLPYLN